MTPFQEKHRRALTQLAAFLLPAVMILTVFAAIGIYPFGERSLLIIDMDNEYIDYLAQMNESVRQQGSFLRSWNMGMGLNMLGLIAFYTSSPFNLLVLLFPVAVITEVIFAITVLKIGLCGFTFCLYTTRVHQKYGLFAVIFSVAYALMSYNLAYASNIMWLDGAAFLPLAILFTHRLLEKNRWIGLTLSLVYVFFTSYYIGYMIGVFAFLYFTATYFVNHSSLSGYLKKLARFVGAAVLAAGCCAFLLLPAFLNLRSGQNTMWDIPLNFQLEKPFLEILSKLLPGSYDTLTDAGHPNLYCSVLAVLGCVLYFLHKKIPLREKLLYGGVLGFLLLSFSCRFLYLAMHAFEDPTWFPARYSFLFSFLVLTLAIRGANHLEEWNPKIVAGGVAILIFLFVEIGAARYGFLQLRSVLLGIVLLLVYGLLWLLYRRSRRGWIAPLVLVIVCAEVWSNAIVMELELDSQFHYKTRDSYVSFRQRYEPALERMWDLDRGVYRTELVEQRNANGGMMLGYNGISHYSTTTDQALHDFLRSLSYNKGTTNELRFARTTPLTNGLLGIRYVLSLEDMGGGYQLVDSVGEVGIYRNRLSFPLAFTADESALSWNGGSNDPFLLQNDWVRATVPGMDEPFHLVEGVEEVLYNVTRSDNGSHIEYAHRVNNEETAVDFYLENPLEQEAYAYLPVWNRKFSRAKVYVNNRFVQNEFAYRNNSVIPLGNAPEIYLAVDIENSPLRIEDHYFYNLDLDTAQQAASAAWEKAASFSQFRDTGVSMTVNTGPGEVLLTTFPYDTGWTVRVNGRKVQPERFAGVFLAIPLEEGQSEVTMRYSTPGFLPGLAVSCGSVAVFLVLMVLERKRKTA